MRFWGNPWIGLVLRLVLAVVLITSGGLKMFDTDASRTAILAYRLVPVDLATPLALLLPAFEIVLAIALLIGFATRWAGLATAILMGVFIVGISSVWIRGYSIDCGCFGGGGEADPEGKTWRYTSEILRDFLFLGMGVWLTFWPRTRVSVDGAVGAYSSGGSDPHVELEGAAADG